MREDINVHIVEAISFLYIYNIKKNTKVKSTTVTRNYKIGNSLDVRMKIIFFKSVYTVYKIRCKTNCFTAC